MCSYKTSNFTATSLATAAALGASLQGGTAFGIGEDETLIARTVSLELSVLWH